MNSPYISTVYFIVFQKDDTLIQYFMPLSTIFPNVFHNKKGFVPLRLYIVSLLNFIWICSIVLEQQSSFRIYGFIPKISKNLLENPPTCFVNMCEWIF